MSRTQPSSAQPSGAMPANTGLSYATVPMLLSVALPSHHAARVTKHVVILVLVRNRDLGLGRDGRTWW